MIPTQTSAFSRRSFLAGAGAGAAVVVGLPLAKAAVDAVVDASLAEAYGVGPMMTAAEAQARINARCAQVSRLYGAYGTAMIDFDAVERTLRVLEPEEYLEGNEGRA